MNTYGGLLLNARRSLKSVNVRNDLNIRENLLVSSGRYHIEGVTAENFRKTIHDLLIFSEIKRMPLS